MSTALPLVRAFVRTLRYCPLLAAAFAFGISCGGGGDGGTITGPQTPVVGQVLVTPQNLSLYAGAMATVSVEVRSTQGAVMTGQSVLWTVSDTATLAVSGGTVTAKRPGTANILAAVGSIQGIAVVTVAPVPVSSVTVTPATANLLAGQTVQLTVAAKDSAGGALAGRAVAWNSGDTTRATVSATGLVSARQPGAVTITAASEGKSAGAALVIAPVPVASVQVTPSTANLLVGQTVQLTAAMKDSVGGTLLERVSVWTSGDTARATVDASGLVRARQSGTVTITALREGKAATATLTIAPVPVASVVITPTTANLFVGQTVQLTAATRDSVGGGLAGRAVTWTSGDTSRATVSPTGLVGARQPGAVTITASSEGKLATAALTIAPVPVATIIISGIGAPQDSLTVGLTRQLAATLRDSAGGLLTDRPVLWSSADTSIASISQTGLVTARAVGTVLLSATSQGHTAQEYIRVRPAIATVAITPVRVSLVGGSSQRYQAVLSDAIGGILQRPVTWTSSAPSIVSVSPSGAASVASTAPVGPVNITATSEGHSGTATINVYQTIPVASVTVSPNPVSLAVGSTTQLSAVPRDPFGDTSPLFPSAQWSSSNVAVAMVSGSGLVTAVANGTATITASVNEGSGSSVITVGTAGPVVPAAFAYTGSYPLVIPIPVTNGRAVSPAPVFQVTGSDGRPFPGATVTASISPATASLSGNVVTTDQNGLASFAGMVVTGAAGAYNISYSAAGVTGGITFQIALTASAQDVTAPQVASLSFAPTTVDITSGAATTVATLRVTDAGSGVSASDNYVSLRSPANTYAGCASVMTLVSGDAADGTYTCPLTIPQGAATGSWVVTTVQVRDKIGNIRTIMEANAAALSSGITVTASGSGPDLTPPAFQSLTITPLAVDVTTGAQTVTATARLTDAQRGVIGMDFILTAPAGGIQASCQTRTIASGTAADGTWTCTATIPLGAQPGDWVIALNGWDAAQNMAGLRTPDLTARGWPTNVAVTSR